CAISNVSFFFKPNSLFFFLFDEYDEKTGPAFFPSGTPANRAQAASGFSPVRRMSEALRVLRPARADRAR
ncbi:MAG: hypothetical protein Q8R89_04950, partial [Desulfomicrobium sp.]|nr:hypothetical protein [Desulfomicrobium sp.]